MDIFSNRILLLSSIFMISVQLAYSQRHASCSPNSCPSYAFCVDKGAAGHLCACRAYHRFSNQTWPKGCNASFVPFGISSIENNGKASPEYQYSTIPDKMLTSSDTSSTPKNGRLLQKGSKVAWCAKISSKDEYLQIDLGNICSLRMIATQGSGGQPIDTYTKTLTIKYSLDNLQWFNITEDGTGVGAPQIFTANDPSGNNAIFYNLFKNVTRARYVRIFPMEFEVGKCIRMELFGERVINECASVDWNICDKAHAKCKDTFAAYSCHCNTGYADYSGTGETCLEIDECLDNSHNCSKYATCANKPGSFTCTCMPGYRGDGYYCEDINECLSDPCHPDAVCQNKNPLYQCTCKSGYAGDGKTCTDIDECSSAIHDCHSQATCTNTKGSFLCTCNEGWTGTGRKCSDIDECGTGTHNCHKFAKCTNTTGSFSCDCIKPGFKGNGLYCYDKDECSLGTHGCKNTERCYNLVGSFKCQCPKEIPMQKLYVDTETVLFGKLARKLSRIDEKNFEYPINYHAQKLRTIYQLARKVYVYHFKETLESFSMVDIMENTLAMEMYDHRCTDVKKVSFPNLCHSNYSANYWTTVTDRIDIRFVWQNSVPFEQWATPPPTTRPTDTTAAAVTATHAFNTTNGTNITTTAFTTVAITTISPKNWQGKPCTMKLLKGLRGHITSPLFPQNYPLNAQCKYLIEVPDHMDVYLNFSYFNLEKDRKCLYDNVRVYDGQNEQSRLLARYCGDGALPIPVRTSGRYMLVVFLSDTSTVSRGFNATWVALTPRVSVTFLAYNLLSFTTNLQLHNKYLSRMFNTDRSTYVPISRLLACVQYPQCNTSIPVPIEFTFEHTINDREDKMCIRWDIDAYGTTWSTAGCRIGLTNKTHTICKCWHFGIVAVLGRDKPYFAPPKAHTAFKLSTNCYMSLVLVILTLIGTLLFLLFKDNWIPYFLTILREKDYDSGRIIQMHIVLNVLLTEIFFSAITFNLTASKASCFFMAFIFYYLLQTVFSWLFIYTFFLQSRISPIFDSTKYNTYKIYLAMGYGIPFLVTLTVTGLHFQMMTNERMCWILFKGTTVWGFSGSIVTLAVGSIILLLVNIYHAHGMEDGILLQEKCLKNMFTTVFSLSTAVFGALAVETGQFGAQYMFSLSNLLQCYSILLIYCILTREQPMVQTNKVAPEQEESEMSALGMLAEIAMKKHLEEKTAEDLFHVEDTQRQHRKASDDKFPSSKAFLNDKSTEFDPSSRPESGIASQSGEETESDEDREDGRILFRFDEYHEMQQFELMQQQAEEESRMREETV